MHMRFTAAPATQPRPRRLEPAGDMFVDEIVRDRWVVETVDFTIAAVHTLSDRRDSARGALANQDKTDGFIVPGPADGVGTATSDHHRVRAAPDQTTVMLQRISYDLDEDGVRCILDLRGSLGAYDAVHVPRNIRKNTNLGYAFVNFIDGHQAAACARECSGRPFGNGQPARMCTVAYSAKQGRNFVEERTCAVKQKRRRGLQALPVSV
eukprot:CAMPEP_0176042468 /NCGR_PEP_ID=MMETSP0120_2-20121206/21072_1 /TAXON_ID=160619 /ORGANISM="Kryptoperidinium foliaceum, Strain CCMP 1326" /LENGTH=208 /DNA_ID=CAMNT_0017375877 /DNA_START=126 /DNA_END=752 /DNA_ORIENTATION=+